MTRMNRQLLPALLTVSVFSLSVATEAAMAQYPYQVAWGQPQAAAVGTYLSPTAAYPVGSMYYPTAVPFYSGQVYYQMAQVTAEPAAVPGASPVPEPQATQYYNTAECQCERCRRARGECRRRRPTGLIDGLWDLEQRKNAFLKRMFFGD
jgi:hypothetical protein